MVSMVLGVERSLYGGERWCRGGIAGFRGLKVWERVRGCRGWDWIWVFFNGEHG